MAFLEAIKLGKCFRAGSPAEVWVLRELSLAIHRGSFVAITGPSGSGKTTLLALLGALDRATQGQILFEGRDLHEYSDVALARVRRRIGFVFQRPSLIRRLSAWENVTYPLVPRGVSETKRFEIAKSLLSQLDMAEKAAKRSEELSTGEQQRVAIARAFAGDPELLLADEPTANLDSQSSQSLISLLRTTHAEGKTVIVATHDRELISAASIVFELEFGKLKEV